MFDKTYAFLRELRDNNNREWYHANKTKYAKAKEEFEQITELLLHEITLFDRSIAGLTPKDCIFRIFRDVRFSKDKSPYKTNFGSFIAPGGRKSMNAGYYLHIEPGSSFIAGGIYMPPSNILNAIRREIYAHYPEYLDIIKEKQFIERFADMGGDRLKNPPRGFDKDFEGIEHLKFKSYALMYSPDENELTGENGLALIVDSFRIALPFVQFMNEAVEKADK